MGKLAAFGALAGVGQGAVQMAKTKQAGIDRDMDEQREMRIAQMQQAHAEKMQGQQQNFAKGQQTDQQEFLKGQQSDQQDFQSLQQNKELDAGDSRQAATIQAQKDLAGSEQTWKSGEGAKDRESAERIAERRAAAVGRGKANQGRFLKSVIKRVDGKTMNENSTVVLTDKQTGQTFEQSGDKFVLQGATARMPKDMNGAMQYLQKSGDVDGFLSKYGFIPASYYSQVLAKSGTVSAPDETDPDSE